MKKCIICEELKDFTEFRKKTCNRDGLNSQCKQCESNYNKMRYIRDKDKIDHRIKKYRNKPESKIAKKDYDKVYTNKTKERRKLTNKEYYENNKDKLKAQTLQYKSTFEGKLSSRASNGKRQALKKSTEDGTVTKDSLEYLLHIQENKCYHCGLQLTSLMHLDHYIPMKVGGSHSIFNVVWSCAKCNLSKSGTIPKSMLRNEHVSLLREKIN